MAQYRAKVTIQWEFDGTENHWEAQERAQSLLGDLLGEPTPSHRQFQVQLEVASCKERVENIRLKEYRPEFILKKVRSDGERVPFRVDGKIVEVKMNSQRYWLFRESCTCVSCGLIGTKMILETMPDGSNPHFNLYGLEDGDLILFTKDHIKPKSFGGADSMDNYNVMCAICNQLKASYPLSVDAVRELRVLHRNSRHLSRKELNKLIQERRLLLMDCLNGQ